MAEGAAEKGVLLVMTQEQTSFPEDIEVPHVTRHATRTEWLAVLAIWVVLNFVPLPFYLADLPHVAWWQLSVILLEDALLWVGLTFVFFHLYDRTPLVRGVRLKHGFIRVVAVVSVVYLQAELIWIVGNWTARAIRIPMDVLEPPYFERDQLYNDALTYLIIMMGAHAWLRKVIQTRLAAFRAARLEGLLSTSRLHALSSELQPHFLFNTMNGIAALIPSDPEQAETMLIKLSELLRHTLVGGGPQGVTLEQELESVDRYLDIQRMRLGGRLITTRSVPGNALEARVPNLILQPLVENAIRHGIEPRPGPGKIAISAERKEHRLVIEVVDDGLGLPSIGRFREGIGTANTRERVEAMFGSGSFSLQRRNGGGVVARLDIPFEAVPGSDGAEAGATG